MSITSTDIRDLALSPYVRTYIAMLGSDDPRDEEFRAAADILNHAPSEGRPIDVAEYFSSIEQRNEDGELYIVEWRDRWNPLIVAFFAATTYAEPDRYDETPWCAAFVNWCFQRVGRQGTNSASSGSFRCEGEDAPAAEVGDVVVFRKEGHDHPCRGQGHVGFFVGASPSKVSVLGGNQSDRIKTSDYSVDSRTQNLWLHSIRSWRTID